MEPGNPDVIEQVPATGNPMQPTSGTYGRVAETERLKQQLDLPDTGPGGAPVQPTPPPPGQPQGQPVPPSSPGQVPSVLLHPTNQPETPASTPLRATTPAGQQTVANHIHVLEALVASPTASDTTKRWAEALLARYKS